mmetsp:Transcript_13356/g.26314  ORF Transcript_13356/g.26314 Transcript_13356/m.26314 type:complete len:251 (+) Transcript_13356:187-939(+)
MALASKPGMGCEVARASALLRRAVMSALLSRWGRKSLRALPDFSWTLMQISIPSLIMSATSSKSASLKPREVMAPVPMRTPPGVMADTSPATEFLLRVMWARSKTFSALEPVMPLGRRSRRIRWFSVPPEMSVWPCLTRRLARATQFFLTWIWYCLNSGCLACSRATASAAMVWLWGPPWSAGKTAWLMQVSKSKASPPCVLERRKKMMPERGPRSDLCVVDDTTSAYSKGESASWAATRPEMWAMSTIR